MTDDLLTLARRLAEGGHLPGINADPDGMPLRLGHFLSVFATEADIHLACHNAIVAKGWSYRVSAYTSIEDDQGPQRISRMHVKAECTTTLSLLRAYAAALEAK